jgi:hypothetical protein
MFEVNRPQRFVAPAALLILGGIVTACPVSPEAPFPRDGEAHADPHGDDDDGHGGENPDTGDRVAFWEVVRTATWGDEQPAYTTRASFFDFQVLGIPRPGGPEDCLVNGAEYDPFEPPVTDDDWGRPSVVLDGEAWPLDQVGDYWSRGLPERTWTPFADATLRLAEGPGGAPIEFEGALSLPQSLDGVSIALNADGLTLDWVAGEPETQLRLAVKGERLGRTEYVVCAPLDDGQFVIEPEMFADYPVGDIEVLLRRERDREDWVLEGISRGRTQGVSQLRASFTLAEDTFDP